MVDLNKLLPLARMAAFGVVCLFSVIIFCLSAHIISLTNSYRRGAYYQFTAVSLATAIMSLLSLPGLFFVSANRRGALPSFVMVEIAWLSFLGVMWVASAGTTVGTGVNYCTVGGICSEAQAIEAFGFLNWLILLAYTVSLLVLSIISHSRGHTQVWKSEVAHFDWNAPAVNNGFQGGVVAPEKQFTGTTVHSTAHSTFQPQQYPAGTVTSVGTPVPQQYPPQQPQYPQQHQVFVGAPNSPMPQSPQV